MSEWPQRGKRCKLLYFKDERQAWQTLGGNWIPRDEGQRNYGFQIAGPGMGDVCTWRPTDLGAVGRGRWPSLAWQVPEKMDIHERTGQWAALRQRNE